MTEKIEWYKEVLELEPNSKVFFPLARMMAEEGMVGEAINILEKGLERHPEYLEARLFIIELLFSNGHKEECNFQVNQLSRMFSSYAGFWQAWAACLSQEPSEEDTASVLRFLAANFISGPLKLHDVINRGLVSIIEEKSNARSSEVREEAVVAAKLLESSKSSEKASEAKDEDSHVQGNQMESLSLTEEIVAEDSSEASSELKGEELVEDALDNMETGSAEKLSSAEENAYALDEETVSMAEADLEPALCAGAETESITEDNSALSGQSVANDFEQPDLEEIAIQEENNDEETGHFSQVDSMPVSEESESDSIALSMSDNMESSDKIDMPDSEMMQEESLLNIDIPEVPDLDAAGEEAELLENRTSLSPASAPADEETAFDSLVDTLAVQSEELTSGLNDPGITDEKTFATTASDSDEAPDFVDNELDEIFEDADNMKIEIPQDANLNSESAVSSMSGENDFSESDDKAEDISMKDDPDEKISLRTRSMAEVLAEQGDIQGALDIYHELVSTVMDEREVEDIRRRISTLQGRLETAEAVSSQPENMESKKLLGMLEALAQRVEARVAN